MVRKLNPEKIKFLSEKLNLHPKGEKDDPETESSVLKGH